MAQIARSPVVTIMGHVDHGKTSLLDAIRKTKVAAGEAGGITQHIGAYQVTQNGKTITFIDTPGHAAFSKMRSRGATATDIVVLVVSAVEGVKPQTIESIQHIKKAGVQYMVALTKMDLPDANPELAKAQLTEHEVFVEGYGGDIVVVPVSAKKGTGLDKLLEMILLVAEMAEFKADPTAALEAIVIESKKDARKGNVATVLVKQGTLHAGDVIYAGRTEAKVRAMHDALGVMMKEAGPSVPVETQGWKEVPEVGSLVSSVQQAAVAAEEKVGQVDEVGAKLETLRVILKSDTAGTLEAIESSIAGERVMVINKGVGEIGEADVLMAESTKAVILGFHVKAPGSTLKLAETHGVKIKQYSIIYELIEDIEKQVLLLIDPRMNEEELGTADVAALFQVRGETVVGCKVKTGEIARENQLFHIKRGEVVLGDYRMKSLMRGKETIESAKAGTECGIVFKGLKDVQVGDVVVAYKNKEVL